MGFRHMTVLDVAELHPMSENVLCVMVLLRAVIRDAYCSNSKKPTLT